MPFVKICGIKTLEDALAAIEAGADLLGFNFYPKSPRFITPQACAGITSILRQRFPAIVLVGVFVNAPASEIRAVLEAASLHRAQLHGDEPPELLEELGPLAFKAVRLRAGSDTAAQIAPYLRCSASLAPALLVDSSVSGLYGGSGQVGDWNAAARLARQSPLLLAGGLTPENVSEAIRVVQPWGVDTASGVESAPGVKDAEKMRKFVQQVRLLSS